jgi:hypothetical protein
MRIPIVVASFLFAACSQAQTYYKLVRTDIEKHIAGATQPQTSNQAGGLKAMELATKADSFESRGNLNVVLPERLGDDLQKFAVSVRLECTFIIKTTQPNLNVGLNVLGVPKTVGKGDPGPWNAPGSHTVEVKVDLTTTLGADFVRKWTENGKNYRGVTVAGHTGVGQTLSGFRLLYVYEQVPDEPAERPGEVRVLGVVGEVDVSPGGDDSKIRKLRNGDRINKWDRIVTGMDSKVQLVFPDGTVVDVGELTDMKVACYIDAGAAVQTALWLRGGEITAIVKKSQERPSDFVVKTPANTTGRRGTTFTVKHDKLKHLTTIRVTDGEVTVTPVNPSLMPFSMAAGHSVDVSIEAVSPVR